MRILFVHSGADLYGASRSLLRLSSRLVRDRHVVMAVLPYEGPLRAELEGHGVQVVVHRQMPVVTRPRIRRLTGIVSLLLDWMVSVVWLSKLARRFQSDVIHTNTALILSPCIAARLIGVPHVWHVREFFAEFSGLWRWYQWFMDWFADVIICVSTPVAQQFDPSIMASRVVVIHNGFPRDEFAPVEQARIEALQKPLGINGKPIVGVIGRIKFSRKGQDVFVRAAALVKNKFPQAQFVCIGSPFPGNEEHLNDLLKLVKDVGIQDRFVYTGDVEDIQAAYAALDVVVLSSAMPEPFGGVVIEAMAMGKPVIGTRVGGTIEQIEDGVTGFLVDPGDPQQLALALERLLSNRELIMEFGANGRRRFLSRFEFDAFYNKLMSVYASLTDRHDATRKTS